MTTEVLPLRQAPDHAADDCATRQIAGDILQAFRMMFANSEIGSEHAPLDTELSRQAAALASARGPAAIENAGRLVSATCRSAVAIVVRRQAVRHSDIASMVAIVRETVDSLADGHAVASAALGESTNRLNDLQQVGEFSRLRELLASEVVTLRRIAADREQAHQQTVATLHERVSLVEQQLSVAREEARIDPLTEVANRRAFDAVLAERVNSATPTSTLILALFDVDGFKAMNDQFGHPAGDAILKHIARSIRDSVRQDDVVARIGGDEFALIASGLTLTQAEVRLRAILHRIAKDRVGEAGLTFSLSCGVSEHSAGDTVQTLVGRTDAALNEAKAHGKNRVVARQASYIRNLLRRRR